MKYLIVFFPVALCILLYILAAIKIYKEVKSSRSVHPVWLLVILFFPIMGPALYLSYSPASKL
jgi:hypothetical protein